MNYETAVRLAIVEAKQAMLENVAKGVKVL